MSNKPQPMTTPVQVALACGHYTVLPCQTIWDNTEVDCWACKAGRQWVAFMSLTHGWNFACTSCPYKRSYGEARVTCFVKATSHAIVKHHSVIIRIDTQHVETVSIQSPTLGDIPPF